MEDNTGFNLMMLIGICLLFLWLGSHITKTTINKQLISLRYPPLKEVQSEYKLYLVKQELRELEATSTDKEQGK